MLERLAQTEIVAAIQPLPPRHRFAVHLTDVRGLDHWQIADLTRIPVGTVTSSLDGGGTVVIAYCCSAARMAGDFLTRSFTGAVTLTRISQGKRRGSLSRNMSTSRASRRAVVAIYPLPGTG